MTVGKDTPNVTYGVQEDYRRLYYSEPEAALKVPVFIQSGYGQVRMGTAMAKNSSAAGGVGKLIPYDPSTIDGTQEGHPRAYLVQDSAASYTVYVTLTDSYRFAVGDDIYVIDSDTSIKQLSAITAIDRTTYTHMAQITFTTVNTADFGTSTYAYVAVEGADTCVGVLEKSVDTGEGSTAAGANATMILGNCVLYTGRLTNMDSAAKTDISASTWGIYTYLK